MRKVLVLRLPGGTEPFQDWLCELPFEMRAIINAYIDRVALGGAKKSVRSLKDGVFEIKIDKGPGYRVYFGQDRANVILLLFGGHKKTQKWDIIKAKKYWSQYAQK